MNNISKKFIAIALAATCMFGTGAILGVVDSPISIGITVSAAQDTQDINSLYGEGTVYLHTYNKKVIDKKYTRAYRSGKKIKGVYFKDEYGKILKDSSVPVYYTIKNWNSNKDSNNYITFSTKLMGTYRCKAYVKYNDGKEQIIYLKVVKSEVKYNDFGYASNFGLLNHVYKAKDQKWKVTFNGNREGNVNCGTLIFTYRKVGETPSDAFGVAKKKNLPWGYVKSGIPKVHGLGLHKPGHVGVYIGGNSSIEAREYEGYTYTRNGNVVQQYNDVKKMFKDGEWFYIPGVAYPKTGWVKINGKAFYYQNERYIADCTKTIKGVTYKFSSAGVSNKMPPESEYKLTSYIKY